MFKNPIPCCHTAFWLALVASISLQAQTAKQFRNLSAGEPSCPQVASGFAAHVPSGARSLEHALEDEAFPKDQRVAVPTFGALDIEGNLTQVGDLKGRVVVVGVWSTLCRPSKLQLQEMRNLQKQIGEKKYAITILAVHLETWPEVQSFLRSNNSLFEGVNVSRVGLGVHGLNVLGPEIKALPALFLIDKQGRIAGRWSGYIPGQLTQRLLNLYNER